VREGLYRYVRHSVCLAQAAPAPPPRRYRDLLQRSEGKSALAISRDLGASYKACFVLLHKLREAMAEEMKGRIVGGPGKVAEIDGGYFGGYRKPANYKEHRRDRRKAENQNGKRKGGCNRARAQR
jgi:hypothetical protein